MGTGQKERGGGWPTPRLQARPVGRAAGTSARSYTQLGPLSALPPTALLPRLRAVPAAWSCSHSGKGQARWSPLLTSPALSPSPTPMALYNPRSSGDFPSGARASAPPSARQPPTHMPPCQDSPNCNPTFLVPQLWVQEVGGVAGGQGALGKVGGIVLVHGAGLLAEDDPGPAPGAPAAGAHL